MKSGPTLNDWTRRPRSRKAVIRPMLTVVLPTLLAVPAIVSRGVRTSSSTSSLPFQPRKVADPAPLSATLAQPSEHGKEPGRQAQPLASGRAEQVRRSGRGTQIAKVQPHAIETVPAIAVERIDDVDQAPRRQMSPGGPLVEGECFGARRPIAKPEPQVPALATEDI